MEDFKPYWFLEGTIDLEYKYYVLMSYLLKIKEAYKNNDGFERKLKGLISMRRDLESFDRNTDFTPKTVSRMTDEEKYYFNDLLYKNLDLMGDIEEIVKNSLRVIEEFNEENKEIYEYYNSLVEVESYCTKYNLWDQGFLVVRSKEEDMRIFTWFFSVVKISQKESVALLMTELLDPRCNKTEDINKIKKFLRSNIKEYSDSHDCLLIADVSPDVDQDTGIEISKEKSIDIIMNRFKG